MQSNRLANSLGDLFPGAVASFTQAQRQELVVTTLPDTLRRDLAHKGQLTWAMHHGVASVGVD